MNITSEWSSQPLITSECGRLSLVSVDGGLPEEVKRKVEVPGRYNLFDAVTRRAKKIERKAPDRSHVVTDWHLTSETSSVQMVQIRTNGMVIDAILRYQFIAGSMSMDEFSHTIADASEDIARMLINKHRCECGHCEHCGESDDMEVSA